ncbi:DLW-39 family protein [Kineococcus indalonis]|nr:DLW-39 family protein [Kineococcus indalonis]
MKKLLLVAAAAGAVVAWRRKASAKAERDLWAEATDTVR